MTPPLPHPYPQKAHPALFPSTHTHTANNKNTVERVGQEEREKKNDNRKHNQMGAREKARYRDVIMVSVLLYIVLVKY